MQSFARLYHYPCNDLLNIVALYAVRQWHRFKAQEVAGLLWSLALLKACPPDTWKLLLDKLGQTAPSAFDTSDQQLLYQAFLLLDSASEACALPAPPVCVGPARYLQSFDSWRLSGTLHTS